MPNDDLFAAYLADAQSIHACCAGLGLPRRIARICTYIHVKLARCGDDYFDYPHPDDETAIRVLQGTLSLGDRFHSPVAKAANSLGANIMLGLKEIQHRAEREYGLEYLIGSELDDRLRLHTDAEYRSRMLSLYYEKIRPSIAPPAQG